MLCERGATLMALLPAGLVLPVQSSLLATPYSSALGMGWGGDGVGWGIRERNYKVGESGSSVAS